jgi:hypothetical protein
MEDWHHERLGESHGNAINYPGNPCFCPACAFKLTATTQDMEMNHRYLTDHAIVITEEGPMGVCSCEEVKDIMQHHFGIRKHEFSTVRSCPEPFLALFYEAHDRDDIFAARSVVDGPIELGFHAWDVDRLCDRDIVSYHIKLCIEGIPHFAWSQDIVQKVICDEASMLHVEEDTQRKVD